MVRNRRDSEVGMSEHVASAGCTAQLARKAAPLARGVGLIAALWRKVTRNLGGGYQPERHYMRGPGPKWREHNPADLCDSGASAQRTPEGDR
jgi:hypothetical protein